MTENQRNRKTRASVTKKDVIQIQNMKLNHKKVNEIAKDVILAASTVYKIIQRLEEADGNVDIVVESFKKPGRKASDNTVFLQGVGEAIQADCCLTQKGICNYLNDQGVEICRSSVSTTIKKLGLGRKRAKKVADKTFSPQIIAERKRYSLRLRNIPNEKLLFLDETGFNLHSCRNYGYSPLNVPCISSVPANRGRNVSFLSVIDENRILNTNSIVGSFNSELFLVFLEECKVKKIIRKDNYVVLDNCRIHKTRDVVDFFQRNEFNFIFLPPYTPQLNPIEQVFSILKNRYYGVRPKASTSVEIISIVNNVIESMNNDVSLSFRNLYSHMRNNLDIAFNGGSLN